MNNEEKILKILENLTVKVDGLQANQETLQANQARLEKRQDRFEDKIEDIHQSVVLLENELLPKVNALFDAFSLSMDYSKEILEPRIVKLEKSVDILQTDVAAIKLKKAE